jgi:hypothetical protein
MSMKKLVVILSALALLACGAESPAGPSPTRGMLRVEGVDVTILESFPPQAVAHVTGQLPNVCTAVAEVKVRRDGRVIEVTITTVSTAEVCILLFPPPLEVPVHLGYVSEPGEYVVRVNGFETKFKI